MNTHTLHILIHSCKICFYVCQRRETSIRPFSAIELRLRDYWTVIWGAVAEARCHGIKRNHSFSHNPKMTPRANSRFAFGVIIYGGQLQKGDKLSITDYFNLHSPFRKLWQDIFRFTDDYGK
jgi:hypothetical protein